MWLPNEIIAAVDRVARVDYIDRVKCQRWNAHRQEGELRLLTGWMWSSRGSNVHQLGLKTRTACYRDAWYALVAERTAPGVSRTRLRVVRGGRAA